MKNIFLKGVAAAATLWAGATGLHADGTLYGVTFFDNQLISLDRSTGVGTLVTPLSETVLPYGIAFRGADLYTFDPILDRVRQINVATGQVSAGIDVGVGDLTGEGDIAFRADGIGFLSSALTPDFNIANDLYRFDLVAGTSVYLGATAIVLDAMAFVGNTLYGIGQESDATLYIVDQNNGGLTTVGSLGLTNNSTFAGLSSTPDGTLYAAINDQLFSVDRLTGLATSLNPNVLDIGFASVSGLAYSSVPESLGLGEVVAAMALLVGVTRWRQRQAKLIT